MIRRSISAVGPLFHSIDRTLIVILLLSLLSVLFMINQFPRVWIDTSWTAVPAYHLAYDGSLSNPMRPYDGLDEHILAPQIGGESSSPACIPFLDSACFRPE